MKVTYYLPDTENPFWKEVVTGLYKVARPEGVELELVSAIHNSELQINQLKGYAEKRPTAILITPLDLKSISTITRPLIGYGIPVVSVETNMGNNASASIISGNMKGGIMAAAFIAERLGADRRIVRIRAEEGYQSVGLRTSSFMDEVKRTGMTLVRDLVANSSRQKAATEMESFLRQNEPFDALFAENDHMALGGIDALKRKQYSPWPVVVGYDGIPEALEAIRNGEMAATIGQNPSGIGEKAMTVMLGILKGEKPAPLTTLLPELITKDCIPVAAGR